MSRADILNGLLKVAALVICATTNAMSWLKTWVLTMRKVSAALLTVCVLLNLLTSIMFSGTASTLYLVVNTEMTFESCAGPAAQCLPWRPTARY